MQIRHNPLDVSRELDELITDLERQDAVKARKYLKQIPSVAWSDSGHEFWKEDALDMIDEMTRELRTSALRDKIIRLAYEKPEIRKDLLPLLKEAGDTFKCPECDTKVLEQTGYCVKCKKKVKKAHGVPLLDPSIAEFPQRRAQFFQALHRGQVFRSGALSDREVVDYADKEGHKVEKVQGWVIL